MSDNRLLITNGDSATALFREAGFHDPMLAWRDCLHEGPVPDLDPGELDLVRAAYLAGRFDQQLMDIQEQFIERRNALKAFEHGRLDLWFEHDLYDQLQLIQILSELPVSSNITLVQLDDFISHQTPSSLLHWQDKAQGVDSVQISTAKRAWKAFRQPCPQALYELDNLHSLPFLNKAIIRLLEELPDQRGISRNEEQILASLDQGLSLGKLFAHCQKQEEAAFLGDLSFFLIVEEMAFGSHTLISGIKGRFAQKLFVQASEWLNQVPVLTPLGREVLKGQDWLQKREINRDLGGTKLRGHHCWRYDRRNNSLIFK